MFLRILLPIILFYVQIIEKTQGNYVVLQSKLNEKHFIQMKILVVNPGGTSTKVAIYEDERRLAMTNIEHSVEELAKFRSVMDQFDFRRDLVLDELRRHNIPLEFDAVIGRGGLVKPISGGTYEINETLWNDTHHALRQHPCNLGSLLAGDIAKLMPGCKALTADPGVVDELEDEARISGTPDMPRITIWHALNQRAVARRFAREHGTAYDRLNLIMCHMGGGISIAAHRKGRAIDANNALDGEGPFSPNRSGSLPMGDVIRKCMKGQYTDAQMQKYITSRAGLYAHLGTTDVREIVERIAQGDKHAELVLGAMIYHTAKAIASEGAVLYGEVDAIILTGGIAHSDYVTSRLKKRLEYLAPVYIYPGEDEMEALAENARAVLRGEQELKVYK